MAKLNIAAVLDIMREVNPGVAVRETDADKIFKEIGFDSLDVASAFLSIEEQYGVQIPDEDIEKLKTINLVLEYVNARVK